MTVTTQMNATAALSASPASGRAPLEVTFTGAGPGMAEGVVVLDFGDGKTDDTISSIRGFTRTHVYRAAGSYTAVLRSGAYGGQRPAVLSEIGRVTIVVD
ncbi:PKD domain-containing protein [Bradyrhizobium sp. Ce-3]|uniref:PKD domain-containing protein n=1 Tax=Bradyrhizobium sp. Ce-3 TaxID=2913970 RepID=UPI001FC82F21|nr:PKD domain-containing protein [Bradyrhizobium sp. Ce-3]